jgi:hypothetical protein
VWYSFFCCAALNGMPGLKAVACQGSRDENKATEHKKGKVKNNICG